MKSQFLHQLKTLMWKNAILKIRNPFALLLELVIPCAVLLALVAIRLQIKPKEEPRNYPDTFSYASDLHDMYEDIPCRGENLVWRCNSVSSCDFVSDNDYTNCQRRFIAVAPSVEDPIVTQATLDFVQFSNRAVNAPGNQTTFVYFESEADFNDYYKSYDYSRKSENNIYSSAVIFNSAGPSWDYSLRLNKTLVYNDEESSLPQTKIAYVQDSIKTPAQDPQDDSSFGSGPYLEMYLQSGYFALADSVSSFVNTMTCRNAGICNSTEVVDVRVLGLADFPNVKELISGFWGQIGDFFALLMIIALLYPLSNNIKSLVVEKETRIREGFLIMSLRSDALWFAWMIHFLALIFPLSIFLTIIGSQLFVYSSPTYVFLYFFMFLLASTSYTILISVMFSKSKSASIIGCLLFFGGYFIYIGLSSNTLLSRAQLMLACLHPATAFTYGTLAFKEYEDSKIGVTELTYDNSSTYKITFSDTITMQAVNYFWILVLAWYLSEVWPSEYGTSKPVYFLFQPSYWRSVFQSFARVIKSDDNVKRRVADQNRSKVVEMRAMSGNDDASPNKPSSPDQHVYKESAANVEAVPEALRSQLDTHRCIEINGLVKSFETATGTKMAVDGLDLTIYSEQITALLGHNGAGKTTLISMLTGLIPISGGTASIFGEDVGENIGEIRRNMGYCPQHDVLIPDMTVAEHLHLFANIKGVDPADISAEVEKMIESVGLTDKRNAYSANLSGGQKRKLSLGIAFIGKSRIVFLDEPTSGMDPYSRRFTWNVIKKHREGRIIVLTTHFMDEADLLGDRIAIMANGKLRCCGSNLYLKQKYGVGYNMTLEKADHTHFDSKLVLSAVREFVPDCTLLTDVGAEMAIQLPFRSSGSFEDMFRALDAKLDIIGIRSYGISATTLEEVFIRVAAGVATEVENARSVPAPKTAALKIGSHEEVANTGELAVAVKPAAGAILGSDDGPAKEEVLGASELKAIPTIEKFGEDQYLTLFFVHVYALIEKRLYYFKRDSKSWAFQFLVPVVFVIIGMIVMNFSPIFVKQPSIVISANMFNDGISTNVLPYPYSSNQTVCIYSSNCSISEELIAGQDAVMVNVADSSLLPIDSRIDAQTIYDMSYYLLENREDFKSSRFGATTFANIDSGDPSKNTGGISKVVHIVHANFTGVHAGPLFAHLVSDALTRVYDTAVSITLRLYPLEETERENTQYSSFNATNVILFLLLALPFIPASFASFVVREKEIKSKHLQLVSGVSVPAYWIGTYIWDLATYMISGWLMIFVIYVFPGTELFTDGKAGGAMIILFLLFGAAIAPFSYLLCFFMKNSSGTQTVVLFVTFVTGLILMIVGIVLRLINSTHEIWMNYLRFIFMLFPAHAFGDALNSIVLVDFYSFSELGGSEIYDIYDFNISGYGMIFLAWESIVYLLLVILIDYVLQTPWALQYFAPKEVIPEADETEPRDIDVLEEEEKVKSGAYDASPNHTVSSVILRDVKKVYSTGTYAVRGVSLGIPNGECFGLLGINGAGKTSLLGMIAGEFSPSSGTASLGGLDIINDINKIRHKIGFCPQFDSLFDLLTGREHLILYAQIKGIKKEYINSAVNAKIVEMGLTEYADRSAGTYSGGNKRKLSVAMAMIGEPSIVFLDEPSTGMDPVARRGMWDIISDISTKREKCSIILTTQSMEECQALCTRIAIMVGGIMRCLGTGQRLRDRFGLGYQIEIGFSIPEVDSDEAAQILYNELLSISEVPVPNDGAASVLEVGDVVRLSEEKMKSICVAKNHSDWLLRFTKEGSGGELLLELESNGSVGLKFFTSWFILEEYADRLYDFCGKKFEGYVLRERQTARVRIEVPLLDSNGQHRTLSIMFGMLEQHKGSLAINEYSIAQTSLEQIFNGFAAKQQHSEEVHVA